MRTLKVALLSLFLSIFLIGCQGDNSDPVVTQELPAELPSTSGSTAQLPMVVLPVQSADLTVNSQAVNIEVRVFDSANNPYTKGNVKIIYPDDVKRGRDVGYFTESSVAVNSAGIANFSYTGPTDLTKDQSPITFAFYHEDNPSSRAVYTFNIKPDKAQVVLTDYTLESSPENLQMGLEQTHALTYAVKDMNGKTVADSDMESMKVTLLNQALGELLDSDGNSGKELTFTNKNNISLNLKTSTISGLIPIKVSAKFKDANANEQTIERIFNVTVLSGPPTAISLSYAGTAQDKDNAKFIESWVLTVTDKYNNRVNTKPSVSMGMLAGYAESSAPTANQANYLYFNPATAINPASATLSAGDTSGASLKSSNAPFDNVDPQNEYVVTFGNGYTYDASGKWTIDTFTSDLLTLKDDFNSSSVSNLGFAVGNNFRQDRCNFGDEWVGNVYPKNGSNIIDESGSMVISVEYDYYLTGKDVMLWVNLLGDSNGETVKIGEAKKVTLRGQGLTGESYSYAKGFTGIVRLYAHIANTVEHYRNANFSFQVTVTGDGTKWNIEKTSMDAGIISCDNNGYAYVDVNISDSPDNGGVITLKDLIPAGEF
jgi:hypothetical protein